MGKVPASPAPVNIRRKDSLNPNCRILLHENHRTRHGADRGLEAVEVNTARYHLTGCVTAVPRNRVGSGRHIAIDENLDPTAKHVKYREAHVTRGGELVVDRRRRVERVRVVLVEGKAFRQLAALDVRRDADADELDVVHLQRSRGTLDGDGADTLLQRELGRKKLTFSGG